jgi:hypothetical protein
MYKGGYAKVSSMKEEITPAVLKNYVKKYANVEKFNTPSLIKYSRKNQPLVREYLKVLTALKDFEYAKEEPNSLCIGPNLSLECGFGCCSAISCAVGAAFIIAACYIYVNNANQQEMEIDWGIFLGVHPPHYTSEQVFAYYYCGLMLGLIFGFLDNFGLFYGMDALNGAFYRTGSRITAGIMHWGGVRTEQHGGENTYMHLHKVTEDLMAGLGNTFR